MRVLINSLIYADVSDGKIVIRSRDEDIVEFWVNVEGSADQFAYMMREIETFYLKEIVRILNETGYVATTETIPMPEDPDGSAMRVNIIIDTASRRLAELSVFLHTLKAEGIGIKTVKE